MCSGYSAGRWCIGNFNQIRRVCYYDDRPSGRDAVDVRLYKIGLWSIR